MAIANMPTKNSPISSSSFRSIGANEISSNHSTTTTEDHHHHHHNNNNNNEQTKQEHQDIEFIPPTRTLSDEQQHPHLLLSDIISNEEEDYFRLQNDNVTTTSNGIRMAPRQAEKEDTDFDRPVQTPMREISSSSFYRQFQQQQQQQLRRRPRSSRSPMYNNNNNNNNNNADDAMTMMRILDQSPNSLDLSNQELRRRRRWMHGQHHSQDQHHPHHHQQLQQEQEDLDISCVRPGAEYVPEPLVAHQPTGCITAEAIPILESARCDESEEELLKEALDLCVGVVVQAKKIHSDDEALKANSNNNNNSSNSSNNNNKKTNNNTTRLSSSATASSSSNNNNNNNNNNNKRTSSRFQSVLQRFRPNTSVAAKTTRTTTTIRKAEARRELARKTLETSTKGGTTTSNKNPLDHFPTTAMTETDDEHENEEHLIPDIHTDSIRSSELEQVLQEQEGSFDDLFDDGAEAENHFMELDASLSQLVEVFPNESVQYLRTMLREASLNTVVAQLASSSRAAPETASTTATTAAESSNRHDDDHDHDKEEEKKEEEDYEQHVAKCLATLHEMFPKVSSLVLAEVLWECDSSLSDSIQQLLLMEDDDEHQQKKIVATPIRY